MEKDKIQDDKIRKLFAGTKITAGENLKYRIMQQIETESVFSAKKLKSRNIKPVINNMLSVVGVMYALIMLTAAGVYLTEGIEALKSLTFLIPIVMISLVCGMFLMISVFDDNRRFKQSK